MFSDVPKAAAESLCPWFLPRGAGINTPGPLVLKQGLYLPTRQHTPELRHLPRDTRQGSDGSLSSLATPQSLLLTS